MERRNVAFIRKQKRQKWRSYEGLQRIFIKGKTERECVAEIVKGSRGCRI